MLGEERAGAQGIDDAQADANECEADARAGADGRTAWRPTERLFEVAVFSWVAEVGTGQGNGGCSRRATGAFTEPGQASLAPRPKASAFGTP